MVCTRADSLLVKAMYTLAMVPTLLSLHRYAMMLTLRCAAIATFATLAGGYVHRSKTCVTSHAAII